MSKIFAVLVVALLAGTPAVAADDQAASDKKERLVCKRGQETGSRTRSPKTCLTAAEWRALADKRDKDNEVADGERMFRSSAEIPVIANPR